jgi:hypothetical protein
MEIGRKKRRPTGRRVTDPDAGKVLKPLTKKGLRVAGATGVNAGSAG